MPSANQIFRNDGLSCVRADTILSNLEEAAVTQTQGDIMTSVHPVLRPNRISVDLKTTIDNNAKGLEADSVASVWGGKEWGGGVGIRRYNKNVYCTQ